MAMHLYRVVWEDSAGERHHAEIRDRSPEQAGWRLGQLTGIRYTATSATLVAVQDAGPADACRVCGVASDAACLPWCATRLPEGTW